MNLSRRRFILSSAALFCAPAIVREVMAITPLPNVLPYIYNGVLYLPKGCTYTLNLTDEFAFNFSGINVKKGGTLIWHPPEKLDPEDFLCKIYDV